MKKSKFTVEQIAFALRKAELGTPVSEVIHKMGISEQTFCRWKQRHSGMGSGELRRLRQLKEENSRDKAMLQDVLSKKF